MNKTTAPGSSSGNFVDKSEGVAGTKIIAADQQAHQDEIVNAITAAGITPSGGDLTQLMQAIRVLAREQAIPVGYLYTQLPGMATPATLWPWATWANESATFAGAFFRAEGGKASAFAGGVQADAFQGHRHKFNPGATDTSRTGLTDGGTGVSAYHTSGLVEDPETDGVNGTPRTADETRPTNYTVRIWRRTA